MKILDDPEPVTSNTSPVIINGSLQEADADILRAFETHPGVYDVIRVMEGTPLFLEDHLNRLSRSAFLAGFSLRIAEGEISGSFRQLIDQLGPGPYSLKIMFSHPDHTRNTYCITPIPRRIPSETEYRKGVSTRLAHLARIHPQIKEIDTRYSERIQKEVAEEHVFEILLVDDQERITEGGKSNIFFIKDDALITPPKDEVLPGITRSKILQIAKEKKIRSEERDVFLHDLNDFDAAFLTGTSIFVLPVAEIDDRYYNSADHPLVCRMMQFYRNLTNEQIASIQQL